MLPVTLPTLPAAAFDEATARMLARCDRLAECTETPGQITRTYCSPAMRDAYDLAAGWMHAAGMQTTIDAVGNLRGRLATADSLRSILIGSHLDSVVNAGRYDGVLGVMMGIALVELLALGGQPLPVPLEVIGFADEEGVRFQTPYLGSRAIAGDFPTELLGRTDADGRTLFDVLQDFGGKPELIPDCVIDAAEVLAYIEPHIEQGPVLERRDLAVASVTGIVGQTRARLVLTGQAGHAGTVPMETRRDALAAAAEVVLAVERLARQTDGLVGTVGEFNAAPNVANVIAGEVTLRLDLRHADDDTRRQAFEQLRERAREVALRREVEFRVDWVEHQEAVACDSALVELLDQATRDAGLPCLRLASGAGHDAAVLAGLFPVGLLFIRCQGGISHHPAEAVRAGDVARALEVLWRTVWKVAASA